MKKAKVAARAPAFFHTSTAVTTAANRSLFSLLIKVRDAILTLLQSAPSTKGLFATQETAPDKVVRLCMSLLDQNTELTTKEVRSIWVKGLAQLLPRQLTKINAATRKQHQSPGVASWRNSADMAGTDVMVKLCLKWF